jgi:hypothetical protein
MQETFSTLLHDPAHWKFEIFLQVLDGIIFGVIWNLIWNRYLKQHWKHHLDRDKGEPKTYYGDTELPY